MKAAGMLVMVDMLQPAAVTSPALMIVAKAVAGVPTCTDRLLGKSADTKLVNEIEVVFSSMETSPLPKFAKPFRMVIPEKFTKIPAPTKKTWRVALPSMKVADAPPPVIVRWSLMARVVLTE